MKSSFDFNLGTPDTPDMPDMPGTPGTDNIDRDTLHSRFVKEYKSVKTTSRSIKYPFSDSVSKHIHDDLDFFEDIQREKMSSRKNKGPVIELCVYYVNTISHKPFLEFMLYKSSDDVMYFPNFVYDNSDDGILDNAEDLLANILGYDRNHTNCSFRGRIRELEIENHIDSADIDSRIILLFELKKKDTDVIHHTSHDNFWWTTVSEIFNYKKVLFYHISNTVTDIFLSCTGIIKIYHNHSLIETPGVFYYGNNRNVIKYNAIFSLNKSPSESRYGPYYYFTGLHTSMKYACYNENNKKRSKEEGGGIVRFIVFHGKMKMFMKSDSVDDSKMAKYIFQQYPIEKKTGQFRDNDCKWVDTYNSAYNGVYHINYYTKRSSSGGESGSESGSESDESVNLDLKDTLGAETYVQTKKKRKTIILAMRLCIDEYSFQAPLSYHYIDVDTSNDGERIPETYNYDFEKYRIL
jgi:hypothetical protein